MSSPVLLLTYSFSSACLSIPEIVLPNQSSNGLLLPSPVAFLTCCSPGLIRANEPELLLCYLGGQSANYFHLILLQAMCSPFLSS